MLCVVLVLCVLGGISFAVYSATVQKTRRNALLCDIDMTFTGEPTELVSEKNGKRAKYKQRKKGEKLEDKDDSNSEL